MSVAALAESFASFGFSVPLPVFGHVFSGFEFLGFILVTATPFGVHDLVEALGNVESAGVAGDDYNSAESITAGGVISLFGAVTGSPFADAVYIGHPGWMSMGGRIGYSGATGLVLPALSWFGILSAFLNAVPLVAISLYVGMLIGAQVFQTKPQHHVPAIIPGLVPHLAAWAKRLVNGALGAACVAATPERVAQMQINGVLYEGLAVLGDGAILSGLVPAAIGVFVIERKRAMGEFAHDFTGENGHDRACCNPRDAARTTGGSSSGSGAAVAAGLVPIALGFDTNGSLRVSEALCGVFSLMPTFGRLPRGGGLLHGLQTALLPENLLFRRADTGERDRPGNPCPSCRRC